MAKGVHIGEEKVRLMDRARPVRISIANSAWLGEVVCIVDMNYYITIIIIVIKYTMHGSAEQTTLQ